MNYLFFSKINAYHSTSHKHNFAKLVFAWMRNAKRITFVQNLILIHSSTFSFKSVRAVEWNNKKLIKSYKNYHFHGNVFLKYYFGLLYLLWRRRTVWIDSRFSTSVYGGITAQQTAGVQPLQTLLFCTVLYSKLGQTAIQFESVLVMAAFIVHRHLSPRVTREFYCAMWGRIQFRRLAAVLRTLLS